MAENCPNFMKIINPQKHEVPENAKDNNIYIQKAQQRHIIIRLLKTSDKEKKP